MLVDIRFQETAYQSEEHCNGRVSASIVSAYYTAAFSLYGASSS